MRPSSGISSFLRPSIVLTALAAIVLASIGDLASVDAAVPPTVAVGDATAPEGNVASAYGRVEVRLSDPVVTDTVISYTVTGGTASAGVDFVARTGRVRIRAGKTTATISVRILADAQAEPDETVLVTVTDATGVAIADTVGVVTIRDDETATGVSIGDVSPWEGDSGVGAAKLSLVLDAPRSFDVFVDYATTDGTAAAGPDYRSKRGRVRIRAGRTSATIAIRLYGDTAAEQDEQFDVLLTGTGGSGVPLADPAGRVTIRDDDGPSTPPPPADLAVVPGPTSRYLTASWSPPATSLAITGYDLEVTRGGTTNELPGVSSPLSFGCGLAVAFDTCTVRVRARSADGPGSWSDPVVQTTWTPPQAPPNLRLLGPGAIAWDAPPSDLPVDHYEVQQSINGGGSWTHVASPTGLTSVACGECRMRVAGYSDVGFGAWAELDLRRPGPPTNATATRDAANPELVHLAWDPPTDPGSHPVSTYEITIVGFPPILTTAATTLDVRLRSTMAWTIELRARNAVGVSFLATTVTVPVAPVP